MHWINHFFFSMNLLMLFFRKHATFEEMIIFTVIFALFIDFDFLFKRFILGRDDNKKLRTWIQEPFGIVLFALPIAVILGIFKPVFFGLTMTSFVSHVILDYITMRKAYPLRPFSNREVDLGFIGKIDLGPRRPKLRLLTIKDKFDENHFLVLNMALFFLLFWKFY